MSKIGGIFFVIILILLVFGIVAFAAEFIFGRPLMESVDDLMFRFFHK